MNNVVYDVGGSSIKVAYFINNEIKKNYVINYDKNEQLIGGKEKSIKNMIIAIYNDCLNYEEKINVGVAFPGIVDSDAKEVISSLQNNQTSRFNISDELMKIRHVKNVSIENDARAAAIGEFEYRKNSNLNNLVHLTVGSAIGGGIIINKQIFKGRNLLAGEFSKLYINTSNEDEMIVAWTAGMGSLMYRYNSLSGKELDGKEIFERYIKGDELAIELIEFMITNIAKLIINLQYCYDFDILTLGGAVSNNEIFFKILKEKIIQYKDIKFQGEVKEENNLILDKVCISSLKNLAACYGMNFILNKQK